jgi:hypothetical protein
MSFKRYDVITFEENDKVVVLESLLHDGREYLYVDEINADETELLEKYKVLEVDYQNGTLNKITDINQLSVLIPLFQEALSKYN